MGKKTVDMKPLILLIMDDPCDVCADVTLDGVIDSLVVNVNDTRFQSINTSQINEYVELIKTKNILQRLSIRRSLKHIRLSAKQTHHSRNKPVSPIHQASGSSPSSRTLFAAIFWVAESIITGNADAYLQALSRCL